MSHELDPQTEWQRLYDLYHAMLDDELLDIAERPEDLTDIARDVLGREAKSRGLVVDAKTAPPPSARRDEEKPLLDDEKLVWLDTYYDAILCRIACRHLEEAEIIFELRDLSRGRHGLRAEGGPAVDLELFVRPADHTWAMTLLREKMGRFPLPEPESSGGDKLIDLNHFYTVSGLVRRLNLENATGLLLEALGATTLKKELFDEKVLPPDEDSLSPMGFFETMDETKDLSQTLDRAGIWYRIVDKTLEVNPDEEYLFEVQIRAIDLPRIEALVEEAANLSDDQT